MSSNENPYQYFENASDAPGERKNRTNDSRSFYTYVDPSSITSVLVLFLIIALVIDSAGGVVSLWEAVVLQNIQAETYESVEAMQAAANASDLRVSMVGILQTFVAVILGIVFLCWTYRVCKNAHALNMAPMRYTPGWAVGWYFIPILNLWKPYQVIKDAFLASCHPDSQYQYGTSLLLIWWSIRIFLGVFGQISFRMAMGLGESPEMLHLLVLNGFQISGDVIGIILNLLTIVIVQRFARCQQETDEKKGGDDFVQTVW